MTRSHGCRGLTLVELTVVLAVGAILLGSAYEVLRSSEHFYEALAGTLEVHQGVRVAAQVLAAELVQLDPSGGDIVAIGPDSISIHAPRMLAFVCTAPDTAAGRLVVRDSLTFAFRDLDPARDRLLVYREDAADSAPADAWLDVGVSRVAAASCGDGARGTSVDVAERAGLAGVRPGAPVRSYERTIYRLYADAQGHWWLGVRAWSDGSWSSTSPIAGPLQPHNGLELAYYDSAGAGTAAPARVVRIDIVVRGLSSTVTQETGGRQRRYADSIATTVTPRNGARAAP